MTDRIRVILVEPNRYRALLIERELTAAFPSLVLVRFDEVSAAVQELEQAGYDVAIVNGHFPEWQCRQFLDTAHLSRPSMMVILVGRSQNFPSDGTDADCLADEYIIDENTAHLAIPRLIEMWLHQPQPSTSCQVSKNRLSEQTDGDIVNLTVGTLAHEINNPLMTILGATELLLNDVEQLRSDQSGKIRVIRDSARRIAYILSDLTSLDKPVVRDTPSGLIIDRERSVVRNRTSR